MAGYRQEIDHAFECVAAIERHLDLEIVIVMSSEDCHRNTST